MLPDSEMAYGAVIVHWPSRKVHWLGMDGNGHEYTARDVLDETAVEDGDPDSEVGYLIFWKDNNQLAVHDRGGFEAEALPAGEDDE
jgi:hypothetical protein